MHKMQMVKCILHNPRKLPYRKNMEAVIKQSCSVYSVRVKSCCEQQQQKVRKMLAGSDEVIVLCLEWVYRDIKQEKYIAKSVSSFM